MDCEIYPMPYRSMTIKEVARMLGADTRRLERMAQRGDIPCQKVGGQFRFNRAEITEWLQQEMGTMSGDHLAEVDALEYPSGALIAQGIGISEP